MGKIWDVLPKEIAKIAEIRELRNFTFDPSDPSASRPRANVWPRSCTSYVKGLDGLESELPQLPSYHGHSTQMHSVPLPVKNTRRSFTNFMRGE